MQNCSDVPWSYSPITNGEKQNGAETPVEVAGGKNAAWEMACDTASVESYYCYRTLLRRSTSATGGAIDNKIEQAMDLVKSHLLFAVREEVEVLKEQINELMEKNEQLQRENSLLRQSQSQGLAHLPYSQAETPQANRHVSSTATTQDQGGFPSMAGGAPRTDGFTQPPPPTEQFAGMQAAGGPTHGQQAPNQQQALPQQQASQYGHIQQQSTLPQQTPHSIPPQQTTTQHAQPPSQT